ncbi:phage tail protein [Streptococcus sp. VTCC 12886]|uniref:phage tail protein n=1 Tax=Streptococcus sp. VTCC 12886 TaxID=3413767 RepID=UPI003D9C714F
MDNIRIAVRDSTDSYNVAFFDNESGIKFKTPNLTKFLAGSASMLSLSFNSKDIDTVKTGCKLSFVYKNKPYWLNIMDIQKTGFKINLIAYSLVLEINNEQKGSYKSDKAQSIAQYVRIFDPENSLTIGINELADKSIKLEWTGTDTLLDRLYSIANSFDAELEFVTEVNSDYSLRRHVLNIYRKGNLGKDLTGQPVRVGKDLKVINYSDNIKELYSAVHATGKDGLTIAGLTKTVNDDAGKPLYVTDGAYLRAPQTRDRFPAVGRNSADNYLLLDLGSTEYETKEALYGYMLAELKKTSVPKVSYTAEGSMDGEIADKMTLIDDLHFDPPLYVQARISEMTEDIITGRVTETTFTNYERKYSQLSDDLLKRVEELAKEAMPYTLDLATNNGTIFKNGAGNSQITPTLKRGSETISGASFVWTINGTSTTASTYTVSAAAVSGTAVVKVEAILAGKVVATTEVTFTDVSDGADGQTAVVHWAYSDNADGTGLTLTDNGQRYIGQYSDYTQADSTDKTKYRWADRWAKIDIDTRNLWIQSRTTGWFLTEALPSGHVTGQNLCYKIFNWGDVTFNIEPDFSSRLYRTVTFSAWIKYENVVQGANVWNVFNCFKHEMVRKNSSTGAVTGTDYQTLAGFTGTSDWKYISYTYDYSANTSYDQLKTSIKFNLEGVTTGVAWITGVNIQLGTVDTGHSLAPEDVQKEIDSKADQEKVVYKTDISVTDEGIIHSASKTVNGQTIASMIAQRAEWVEIIANLLKVKGNMIVDGTIGANKLSVSTLSALAADLGQISGGSLELLKSEAQATSTDSWGSFVIPAHKWGLYIDNIGAISSGTPVRKSSSESTASDMPVAVLTSGQLRFARVNQNNDLGSVLHYGLSDPDNATISFVVASDGTKQLLIQANGQIVNQGTNYTGWNSTGVAGVYYKRQGDVVALKLQVTTTANQSLNLGSIPVALLPIANNGTMMRVTAWTTDQSFGRNLQINGDGSMVLLASNRGDTINTQVTWII